MSSYSSASAYWSDRRARDKANKLADAHNARMLWSSRVRDAAVATVLPGQSMPTELNRYPVVIHNTDGSKTVCNHLAA